MRARAGFAWGYGNCFSKLRDVALMNFLVPPTNTRPRAAAGPSICISVTSEVAFVTSVFAVPVLFSRIMRRTLLLLFLTVPCFAADKVSSNQFRTSDGVQIHYLEAGDKANPAI